MDEVKAPLLSACAQIIFEDDDEETLLSTVCKSRRRNNNQLMQVILLNKKLRQKPKITCFIQEVVEQYDDVKFKADFRMTRATMQVLLQMVEPHLPQPAPGYVGIADLDKVIITVWYLANQCYLRTISRLFGVEKSTILNICLDVCKALLAIKSNIITWPKQEEYSAIAQSFAKKKGLSGVIGAIDGSYIDCKPPNDDRYSFINRKGNPSLILQAVCDYRKVFRDIYCDRPGSLHDARVLRLSPLGKKMEENTLIKDSNYHLLGDSAYPCHRDLITPFRNNGHLTQQQKDFNYYHSSTRVVIENAFGLLKCKFRRLLYLNKTKINQAPDIIEACCVIHNIIIFEEGQQNDIDEADECQDDNDAAASHHTHQDLGQEKRNKLMLELC